MPGTFVFKPIEATLDYKPSVGLHPENLDPYCKVKVGNVALSTHPSRNHGIHPHWDDNLVVQQGEDSSCIVTVKDKNKGTLGEVKLDLDEIEARGKVAKWFDIKKDRKVQGQLMMEVVYTSANPQSRSWHLSAKEGAALAGDHVRVKEHASPSEIGPFRVYERLRIPSKKCSHNGHMTAEELVEARKHIGNNALARYVADHMSPLDHTLVKHEIADHNARVLNSSHTQRSGVIVRDEPPLHKVEPVTVRDKVEVQAHVAGNGKGRPSTGGRSSTGVRPSNWNYTNAKDAVDVARHLGSERKVVYDDGYVRMKGVPVTGESKVSHATPLETAEAKQHMGNPILKNKTVKIMEPVTNQDVSDVVQHVGNISPSGQEGAVVTGHTDDYYVKKQYVNSPVVENYVSQSGNAHAGHSHLVNAKPRVQRDGTVIIESPGYVTPVVVESHVEGDQPGYAHAGHAGLVNARPRVERGGALIVGNPGYVAPVVVRDHVQVSQPGNAHAGHSSLQHGRVRVERDAALVHLPQQGIVPGSNWINNVVERESVASSCVSSCASCSSCTSAWEGMSNPNNAGKSREYLRGLDRVNMLNEKEKELSCDSCSVRSDLSDLKKRDYWYLNNIGMSDPNTAKLGVNHSKDRCGLVDQKHHHHHHHHHHGHHHGHHRGMRDRVVYETPTLADINTIGGNGVVYRKH